MCVEWMRTDSVMKYVGVADLNLADKTFKGVGEPMQEAKLLENLIEYFKSTNSGKREQAYFDKMLDLKYENECLK